MLTIFKCMIHCQEAHLHCAAITDIHLQNMFISSSPPGTLLPKLKCPIPNPPPVILLSVSELKTTFEKTCFVLDVKFQLAN